MPVMCFVCDKLFSRQSNVNKHYKNVHKIKPKIVSYDQTKWSYKCLESGCCSSFQHNIDLINHLSKEHNIHMQTERMKFVSKEDFYAWKHLSEKESKSEYIILRSYKMKGKIVRYYTCNRSGKRSSVSNNVRLPKSQGSCKLNRYCTSGIKVIEDEDILVTWYKTHYGHSIDLQHIRIPKIDRSVIASKLTLGVPPSRILDSYRDQIGDNISREDLITRKDIHNIKTSYHINILGVKHENDAMSVELWIKQCEQEENNPILLYKKQGVEDHMYGLRDEDFCLVIMTDFQKIMFKKFGNNIIAIDGTHGLNNYNFELTSLLVMDEFGEGIPVAFMFTNRKDTYIYELFFNAIKLSIGIVSAKTFMSDIVSTFYSAWCCIMGPVVHQLFCSWHVDRAWQQNLSKIRDKNKRTEVYKVIKFLQQNTDIEDFDKVLKNTISELISDVDTQSFGIYFQNNYSMNFEKWAYCFRRGCGINTNMRLESMHKIIKYFYLDGKKVKRLYKSLHVLLKFVRDKCVDRVIKTIKGKHSIHMKEIVLRHKAAVSSKFSVEVDCENENKWYIQTFSSKNNELYCVEKLFDQSCCNLVCRECKICSHTYSCSCNDFCVANSICKHIHYIEMTHYTKSTTEEMSSSSKLDEMKLSTGVSTEFVDKSVILRQNFSAKILKTMTKLQNADKNKLTDEVILQIESHLTTVEKLLEIPCTSDENFIPQISHQEPGIKKIDKQPRFFSTQKKKNRCKNFCKKASSFELGDIERNLKSNFTELYVSHSSTDDHNYL